jgi:hypothetical protein
MPESRATSIISGIIQEVNNDAVNVHRQQLVITASGNSSKSPPVIQFQSLTRGAKILGIYFSATDHIIDLGRSEVQAQTNLNQPLIAGGGGRVRGWYDNVAEGIDLRRGVQIRYV